VAAEIVVLIAQIVGSLASGSVSADAERRGDAVVNVDAKAVPLD
jgi:hypothetical protein